MIATLEVIEKHLQNPRPLMIAGKEETLRKIPRGNWIGGTVPFLISDNGNEISEDYVDLTVLPGDIRRVKIKRYDLEDIHHLNLHAYETGFTFFVIPGESKIHHSFAMNSRDFQLAGKRPVMGWVSGYSPKDSDLAKVFYGPTGECYDNKALALHCHLPDHLSISFNIINLFEPGTGDILEFPKSGFSTKDVIVNGEKKSFSQYLKDENIDIRLPLISTEEDHLSNVSFKEIGENEVFFFAPVFDYFQYKIARPIESYYQRFSESLEQEDYGRSLFNCNCILNYEYADLKDKNLGDIQGPVTFGEIANHLQNQTFVSMFFKEV